MDSNYGKEVSPLKCLSSLAGPVAPASSSSATLKLSKSRQQQQHHQEQQHRSTLR